MYRQQHDLRHRDARTGPIKQWVDDQFSSANTGAGCLARNGEYHDLGLRVWHDNSGLLRFADTVEGSSNGATFRDRCDKLVNYFAQRGVVVGALQPDYAADEDGTNRIQLVACNHRCTTPQGPGYGARKHSLGLWCCCGCLCRLGFIPTLALLLTIGGAATYMLADRL